MKRLSGLPGLGGLLLLAIASSVGAGGCLNPRPEDFPSDQGSTEPAELPGPNAPSATPEGEGSPGFSDSGGDTPEGPVDGRDDPDAGAPDAATVAAPSDAGAPVPAVSSDTGESR